MKRLIFRFLWFCVYCFFGFLLPGVDGGAGAAATCARLRDRRRGAGRERLGGFDHLVH